MTEITKDLLNGKDLQQMLKQEKNKEKILKDLLSEVRDNLPREDRLKAKKSLSETRTKIDTINKLRKGEE